MSDLDAELKDRLAAGSPAAASTRPTMRLLEFKAIRKNSLRGFATVKLPNGLIINDIVVGEANGRQWALLPSKPMIDRDGRPMTDLGGKPRYSPVNEWGTRELQQEFSRRVVDLVRAQYPASLDA
jgi:hypothetical protein